jgi:hypothetical protein
MMCHGLQIIVSDLCLEETDERLFPPSRHRSRRIRKKLIKRHGGEFRKAGVAYRHFGTLICHPTIYDAILKNTGAPIPMRSVASTSANPLLRSRIGLAN